MRLVEQTVNPKTGSLNKPKCSTYYPLMVLVTDENNHVKMHVEDFYDDNGKVRGWEFLANNFDLFTKEEIEYFALHNIVLLKADIYAKHAYCGSDLNKLLPLYDNAMNTLVEIAKTGANKWAEIKINWAAVNQLKVDGFNPFKITNL